MVDVGPVSLLAQASGHATSGERRPAPVVRSAFPAGRPPPCSPRLLLTGLAGYASALGWHAASPPRPPVTQAVASWLTAHRPTSGIGDYWAANITTVVTGGTAQVRPVRLSCGRFVPKTRESRQSWYTPPATATFLVLGLAGPPGANGTAQRAAAQFGAPEQTARIGAYEVLVWRHDLLPALTGGSSPGCDP